MFRLAAFDGNGARDLAEQDTAEGLAPGPVLSERGAQP